MPVERGPRITARGALVVAIAATVAGFGIVGLVLWLADTGGVDVQLGSDVFEAGEAGRIAAEIADRGPILYSDVAGGNRDLYLVHIGDDPAIGWSAFAAQQPGAPRECFLEWDTQAEVFTDSCDGTTFPLAGDGLTSYPVYLEDDDTRVVVDLNQVRTTTSGTAVDEG